MGKGFRTYRIVHEIPERLRLYCPGLYDPNFDPAYLDAFLSNIQGVEKVRLNIKAASIVVRYNGDKETRKAVLDLIADMPDEVLQANADKRHPTDSLEVAGVLSSAKYIPSVADQFSPA